MDVGVWPRDLGLAQYEAAFRENRRLRSGGTNSMTLRAAGRLLMQLVPDETITSRMSVLWLRRPEDCALIVCGLRQAGVPE